jgi:putative ABC transport system substrate-binding protein
VIVTQTLPAALAAKAATASIPIVFVIGEDPVEIGLVPSLNRPGGNITGISNFMNLLGAKRLELLAETVPNANALALLVNPQNPNAEPDTRNLQAATQVLGRRIVVLKAASEADLETAFAAITEQRLGGLFVNIDTFLDARADQIIALAAAHRVPASYPLRRFVVGGGLMSYDAVLPTRSAAPASMPAAFSRAKSQQTCRSSSRRTLIWRLTSRRREGSTSTFRPRCSRSPTR